MTAQGTEARRVETACGLDAKHDGPVGAADAPTPHTGPERRHLRGAGDPVRSLAEAKYDIARRALREARDILANPAFQHLEGRCRALLIVGQTLNRLEDE